MNIREIAEPQEGKMREEIYKILGEPIEPMDEMRAVIRNAAERHGLKQTAAALSLAEREHAGQYRRGERQIAYINHPLTLARQAIAMGVIDDDILAAALLHDVVEDCQMSPEELQMGPVVTEAVRHLTITRMPGESKAEAKKRYFAAMEGDDVACFVKLLDRCNNISEMATAFSSEKMLRYIEETVTYILPIAQRLKARRDDLAGALFLLRYQLLDMMESIALVLKENEKEDAKEGAKEQDS